MLTFLPLSQIEELSKLSGSEINKAKEILAYELTALVHSKEDANKVQNAAKSIFESGKSSENMPITKLSNENFDDGKISISDILLLTNLVSSKSEARRLIDQGGLNIIKNDEQIKVNSCQFDLTEEDLKNNSIVIKKGKKVFHKVTL